MNKWKSAVHGGMSIIMFTNNSMAIAQTSVRANDGNVSTLGAKADTACVTPSSTTCSVVSIMKGAFSATIAGASSLQGNNSTSVVQLRVCGNYTTLSLAVATTLQIVAAASGKTIYVCDFDISNSATTTNVSFQIGTGTNCATGSTQLGQTWYANANWGKAAMNSVYRGMNSGAVASSALCVKITTASNVDVGVYYDQF